MKELLLIGFIITAPLEGHTNDEKAALTSAARAFYKQSELEKQVNNYIKEEVPKSMQVIAGNAVWIAKTVQSRRLIVTWSF